MHCRALSVIWIVLVLSAAACRLDDSARRNRCVVDQDCNPGRYCDQGLCLTGPRPSPSFALEAEPGASLDFGDVVVGEMLDQTFLLSNNGSGPGSAVVTLNASRGSDFSILGGDAEDCAIGRASLDGSTQCSIRIRFVPSAPGMASATLTLGDVAPGTSTPLLLTGNGRLRATLLGSTSKAFDTMEVGTSSAAVTWTIKNVGDLPTGPPVLDNNDIAELLVANHCTNAIAGGDSCSIDIVFRPTGPGPRRGVITLSAQPGGSARFEATTLGQYRVTVSKLGGGTGTIMSIPPGLTCDGNICSLLTDAAAVTLKARTSNGSDSFFSGWVGADCSGPFRDCTINISGTTALAATFAPMTGNLVFVTSGSFSTNKGQASLYDDECNLAATAAGINNSSSSAYVAMVSDHRSSAASRLAGAEGWLRMDGKPFADLVVDRSATITVLNSVRFDETGNYPGNVTVMTGTSNAAGATTPNCAEWTDNTPGQTLVAGYSEGGPFAWAAAVFTADCSTPYRLLCMGRTRTTTLSQGITGGRKVWMSNNTFIFGTPTSPNQLCQSIKPPDVDTAAALIAYTDRPAAAVLDMSANYVRLDGTLIGTGAQIAAGNLESGIWQDGASGYVQLGYFGFPMWTGHTNLVTPGTIAGTCGNWSDLSQTAGIQGDNRVADPQWWFKRTAPCNNSVGGSGGFYCVQTAP